MFGTVKQAEVIEDMNKKGWHFDQWFSPTEDAMVTGKMIALLTFRPDTFSTRYAEVHPDGEILDPQDTVIS